MDLEPDRRAGRRTLAGVLGARPAKWLLDERPRSVARRLPRGKRCLVRGGRLAPVGWSPLLNKGDAAPVSRVERCGTCVHALDVARGFAGGKVVTHW